MNILNHSGLAGYVLRARLSLTPVRPDGSIALIFDRNLRVVLHPAGRGEVVLEAQAIELPSSNAQADETLSMALLAAAGRPALDADHLALSADGARLMVQQRIGADVSADEFEAGLGNFLDAVTGWRALCGVL